MPFINLPKPWEKEWQDMPEFIQEDLTQYKSLVINFKRKEDVKSFIKLTNQKITNKTRSIWYPEYKKHKNANKRYIGTIQRYNNPKYPVYIISKGRWESRLTSKALEKMNVPYYIVIEPQEYDQYSSVIDKNKILVLPFSNLGQGSIPARNWVWEHSISIGALRHWILDDNLKEFFRVNQNREIVVSSGTIFRCAEDFTDRYKNIALSGLQYFTFAPHRRDFFPFYLNTRIYSCILIKNDIPYRWRGRYNEDTDLSIRVLKDKWCTVLFYAFLCHKTTTMKMTGGNTDDLYQDVGSQNKEDDGRWKMAESLRLQHPNIVKITRKWNRWQHHVDYSFFRRNKLIKKPNIVIPKGINNYEMKLIKVKK